ncbi:MAG: AI-2E family transporter [Bacteroidota bacterium]
MALAKYQRYLVTLIPLLLVGLVFYYFSEIFSYIVLGWVVSMLGAPIHKRLEPLIGGTGAAISTIALFTAIFILLVYLFIPPIVQQTRNLAGIDYDGLINGLEEPLEDWNDWLIGKGILSDQAAISGGEEKGTMPQHNIDIIRVDTLLQQSDSAKQVVNIIIQMPEEQTDVASTNISDEEDLLAQMRQSILSFLNPQRIQNLLGSVFGAVGNILITTLSVFFIAFFFLKESRLLPRMVQSLSTNENEEKWSDAIDKSSDLLKRYFIGIAVQVTLITILVTGALTILGFKNALLIGFFAALMNVVPYVGPFLGGAFGIVITISSNVGMPFYDELLPKLGIIAAVFAAMQLIDNFIIQPNIFSKSVKAHPLEIFIVVLMGAKLGGILGMVIAIPVYTVIRVLASVFLSEFKVVQRITQGL